MDPSLLPSKFYGHTHACIKLFCLVYIPNMAYVQPGVHNMNELLVQHASSVLYITVANHQMLGTYLYFLLLLQSDSIFT